jgi:tetratricopeptide (TPR) repeat protein/DNA-binding XRE family transcriptional regulator
MDGKVKVVMDTPETRPFGEELRTFRERKRMSQDKLAQAIGVNRQTIVAWELGKNPPRDRTRVLELAQSMDLDDRETNILLAAAFLDPLAPFFVSSHRNRLFTGREKILQELHHELLPGTTAVVSQSRAISGLGGIGKTQIVLEYAYRYRNDYSAILWLQADSREFFFSECVRLAQELALPERNEADQTPIVAAVKRWLKGKTKWLLILDNVEDLSMVEEFLPPGHHGCVLLTTRTQQVTEHIALVHALEGLPKEEGTLLLLHRAGLLALDALLEQAAPEDYEQALALWELVEGLPLALDQIGAYIRATGRSLASYRVLYEQRRLDLLKERGKTPPGHKESVVTTFSVAFDRVQIANPAAADLLRLCAFLHPKAIPMELITESPSSLGPHASSLGSSLISLSNDPLALDKAIAILGEYSLLDHNTRDHTLNMHRLVQAVLADGMDAQTQHLWAERVIITLNASLPDGEDHQWNRYERYLNHLLNCVDLIDRWQIHIPAAAYLLHDTARYLQDRARYAEAKPLYLRTLQIRRQALGQMHPEIIAPLFYLANLCQDEGQYLEAENLYQEVSEICEHTLAPDDPRAISAICALARNYFLQDEYDLALMFYHTALQAEKPPKLTTLNDAGQVYQKMGQYTGAELLYQQALEICEQTPEPNTLDTFIPITSLATLYHEQGEYDRAEALYRRALHLSEQTLGSDHPDLSSSLHNLAELYQDQRRYDEAEPLYQRALRLLEQTLGPDHLRVTSMLNGLATLRARQGQHAEAKLLFQRVLQIREQILGPAHSEVALSLFNLATLCTEQGQYTEAEPLFQRALQIQERLLGSTHFKIAHALSNLAHLYIRQGHATKAVEALERALDIWKKTLGLNHPQVRSTATMYVRALRFCGRYDEAKNLEAQLLPSSFQEEEQNLLQVLHLRERAFGSDRPEVAASLNSLAAIYLEQGRLSEAEQFCRRALDIYEQTNHPFASATRVLLATITISRISLAKEKKDL